MSGGSSFANYPCMLEVLDHSFIADGIEGIAGRHQHVLVRRTITLVVLATNQCIQGIVAGIEEAMRSVRLSKDLDVIGLQFLQNFGIPMGREVIPDHEYLRWQGRGYLVYPAESTLPTRSFDAIKLVDLKWMVVSKWYGSV
jgi:hypothetical protein